MSCSKVIKLFGIAIGGMLMTESLAQADIVSTIQNAAPGTTVSVSGTYAVASEIHVPTQVTVKGPATFNFSTKYNTTAGFYCATGNNQQLISLTVTGANHGIYVTCANVKVTSCIAHNNYNTGIQVSNSGGKNCTVSGCTSYDNVDSQTGGGNADGIDVKAGSGSGNKVTGCTAYSNSDDGYDCEKATSTVTFSSCTSYSNGSFGGFTGNGNGFKMGISGDNVAHSYTSCVAHNNGGNSAHGFSTNGNVGKIKLTTCHSYSNNAKDVLGNCVLSNCTMQT